MITFKKTRDFCLLKSRYGRFSDDEQKSILDFLDGLKRYSDEDLAMTWEYFRHLFDGNYLPLYAALEIELYLRGLTDSPDSMFYRSTEQKKPTPNNPLLRKNPLSDWINITRLMISPLVSS